MTYIVERLVDGSWEPAYGADPEDPLSAERASTWSTEAEAAHYCELAAKDSPFPHRVRAV
jgi:hypothetical protein